jgi:hypothetical protein
MAMTQSVNHIPISKLNKLLPKNLTHKREEAKIKFIKKAVQLHRTVDIFGVIDFSQCYWDGKDVHISYAPSQYRMHIKHIVAQVMVQKFFGNLSKNENVFFYRFLNIFRALVSASEWKDIEDELRHHDDLHLRENVLQYVDYRNKLTKIVEVLSQKSVLDIKED